MPGYYRPFVPLVLALLVGTAVGSWMPNHRPWAYGLVAASFSVLLLVYITKKTSITTPYLLFMGLGYLLIQPWVTPDHPEHHISRFSGKIPRIITGVIDTPVFQSGYRQKFTVMSEQLGRGPARKMVSGRIRVSVANSEITLMEGDRISFVGTIKPIRSFQNGGFNYQRYMAYQGIWASASANGKSLRLIDHPGPPGIGGRLAPARQALATRMEKVLAPEHAGIVKALVLGDRRGISEDLRESFQRAGLGHLLAISGLHVGIVATAVFLVFSFFFKYVQPMLFNAWTQKGAAVASILVVWGYGFLAGMSPSTFRAAMMASVFLLAIIIGRTQDTLTSLAVAAMVIVILEPPALFSISFQLSFTAVAAIVLGLGAVTAFREKKDMDSLWQRVWNRWGMFMWVSFFAILGTLPLVLYYFHQTSTLGLVSNLIFIPLLGFVLVPLALVSSFFLSFSAALSGWGFKLCGVILGPALSCVRWVSQWPFSVTRLVTPSSVEIALYYGIVAMILWAVHGWHGRRMNRSEGVTGNGFSAWGTRGIKTACLLFGVLGLFSAVDVCYWVHRRYGSDLLRATVIDVGHGNATLIEFPRGATMLIDGGGFSDNAAFDVGKRIVAPLLWQAKIKTIDTVVLSHPNSDHLNGLVYILAHFHVKRVWANGEPADTKGYREFLSVIQTKGIKMPAYGCIKRHHIINGAELTLLYPPHDFLKSKAVWRNSNNNSLVLRVSLGDVSFLIPGDIMAEGERELLAMAQGALSSDVLLAPHHGSRTSNTVGFLEAVEPRLIIVSSGEAGLGCFPHPTVLKRYQQVGAKIVMTGVHGAVKLNTDGSLLKIKTTAESMEHGDLIL